MERALIAAVLLLAAPGSAAAGEGKPSPHPHFDDGGTLDWTVRLADARKAAKEAGKLILVEYGREA